MSDLDRLQKTADMVGLTLPELLEFLRRRIGDPLLARRQEQIRQDIAALETELQP